MIRYIPLMSGWVPLKVPGFNCDKSYVGNRVAATHAHDSGVEGYNAGKVKYRQGFFRKSWIHWYSMMEHFVVIEGSVRAIGA